MRIGWLAQTALLAVQAARTDGFPWSSWAGSLNLFVWFVVGAYLIWGCRPRFRLLGLGVMPLAVALFVVARVGGGTAAGARSHYSNLFLVLHVGFVLAAFAGFTLAAALAALYLWEERRLKRRAADILRLRLPPLASLERLAGGRSPSRCRCSRSGSRSGIVRLRQDGGSRRRARSADAPHLARLRRFVVTRPAGRRAAYLALGGFALVIVARLALAGGHFA